MFFREGLQDHPKVNQFGSSPPSKNHNFWLILWYEVDFLVRVVGVTLSGTKTENTEKSLEKITGVEYRTENTQNHGINIFLAAQKQNYPPISLFLV